MRQLSGVHVSVFKGEDIFVSLEERQAMSEAREAQCGGPSPPNQLEKLSR